MGREEVWKGGKEIIDGGMFTGTRWKEGPVSIGEMEERIEWTRGHWRGEEERKTEMEE